MGTPREYTFVDEDGQPFDPRIQQVLREVRAPLRARFPSLADDTVVTEVIEDAGRRIRAHERAIGPVRNLSAYAWVTAQNLARSRGRRSEMRLAAGTRDATQHHAAFESLAATVGTAEQVEAQVLVRELVERLTDDERQLVEDKLAGLYSREIAEHRGMTVAQVDIAFFRLKGKLARLLGRTDDEPLRPLPAKADLERPGQAATRGSVPQGFGHRQGAAATDRQTLAGSRRRGTRRRGK